MKNPFHAKFVVLLSVFFLIVLVSTCDKSKQPGLKDVFKDDFYIGVALNEDQFTGRDARATAVVEKHFNSLTPENCLKWEKVHPEMSEYNFQPSDAFTAFGEERGLFLVGHTLVWHQQTPDWVFEDEAGNPVDKETLLQRLKEHIFTVVGRYKGRIDGWDVVNEAFEDDGQLRQSKWLQIIGEEYIQKAFEWAHEADPGAELYYNDYNMWYPGKRDAVVRLVRYLQSKGVPIHGIGLQGHWGLDYPPLDELEAAMTAYARLGLPMIITEMDMDILPLPAQNTGADISLNYELLRELNPYPEVLPDSMQVVQSNRYAEFFRIFSKHSDQISRVTLWGIHDGQSWRNNWPVRGRSAYPLLFDDNYQPKPALDAIIKTAGGE